MNIFDIVPMENIIGVIMKNNGLPLKHILLIFFVAELLIAGLLLKYDLKIGHNPETNQRVWLENKHNLMTEEIDKEIQPDLFVKEEKISNPESFTYGSKTLYNIFYKMFGEKSAILNFRLYRMLFYLDLFLLFIAIFIRVKASKIPSKIQVLFEMFYGFFDNLVAETLGEGKRHYTKYFFTTFLFIWMSNWCGLLPIPGVSEPTRNLNVPLGMGLMSIAFVHFMAFRKKGPIEYFKGFCEPVFFLAPLNIVGELSKVISISFRLFGNIFGGAIITLVVSSLTKFVLVPIGLNMFFTMFAGTVQAFVFTMLSLTYLSMEIGE